MKAHLCMNHPDRVTKTRCYHCKSYICMDCVVHKDRHYFCSNRCVWQNRWIEFKAAIVRHKTDVILGWNALLTIGLLVAFLLYWRTPEQANAAIDPASQVDVYQPFMLTAPLDSLKKNSGEWDAIANANSHYDLTLELQKGWIVNIWRNDWPVVSEIVETAGSRRFTIPLQYDRNQIRVGVWNQRQQIAIAREFTVIYHSAMVETLSRSVGRGNPLNRRLSLTFDGGSLDNGAAEILDILRSNGIHTTMFLTGQFIEKYPNLVLRMLEEGHEIGNHTYNHPHLTTYDSTRTHDTAPGVDRTFLQQQLRRTDSLFTALTGQRMKPYWRAPYGEFNREILQWAAEAGYMHIYWGRGLDTRDWIADPSADGYQSPQQALNAILKKDNERFDLNGGIVLMHLGTERAYEPMYEMLPELINQMKYRGFEITSVTRLLNP